MSKNIRKSSSDCTASLSLKPLPAGVPIPGRKWPPLWHLHHPWHGILLSTCANCIGWKKTTNSLLCLHSLWWSWWFSFVHFFIFTPKNWGWYPHLIGRHFFLLDGHPNKHKTPRRSVESMYRWTFGLLLQGLCCNSRQKTTKPSDQQECHGMPMLQCLFPVNLVNGLLWYKLLYYNGIWNSW